MSEIITPQINTLSPSQLWASKQYYQKIVFDILESEKVDTQTANLITEHIVLNWISWEWNDRQTMQKYYENMLWVSEKATQKLIDLFDETHLVEITFNEDIEENYWNWWFDGDWWELLYEKWDTLSTVIPINSYTQHNDGDIIVYHERLWKKIHLRLAEYIVNNKASFSLVT
jgi:hypothetical protein